MKTYALPLFVSLIIFAKCAKDWDRDGRQTGGGRGRRGGVGEGGFAKSNLSLDYVDPKGLRKLKLKQVGDALRSRRAVSPFYFFIAHQLARFHADIKDEQVCFVDGSVPESPVTVPEYRYSTSTVKIGPVTGKTCRLVISTYHGNGFSVTGELTGPGVSVFKRSNGDEFYKQTDNKKVKDDISLEIKSGSVNAVISELFECTESSAFQCDRGGCISQDCICDNAKNCNDGSDESSWRCSVMGNPKMLTFIAFLILVIILTPIIILVKRFKKKKKTPSKTSQHGVSTSSSSSSNR